MTRETRKLIAEVPPHLTAGIPDGGDVQVIASCKKVFHIAIIDVEPLIIYDL